MLRPMRSRATLLARPLPNMDPSSDEPDWLTGPRDKSGRLTVPAPGFVDLWIDLASTQFRSEPIWHRGQLISRLLIATDMRSTASAEPSRAIEDPHWYACGQIAAERKIREFLSALSREQNA